MSIISDDLIYVSSPSFCRTEALRNRLESYFSNIQYNSDLRRDRETFLNNTKECNAAIIGLEKVDAEFLDGAKNLRVISKMGVGLNNIDFTETEKRNISCVYSQGVNREAVAEITIAAMIGLSRNVFQKIQEVKTGTWVKQGGHSLSELTIGIIGTGYIGKTVIQWLQPFGPKIIAHDLKPDQDWAADFEYEYVSKEEIFKQSDIVSLHIPQDESTLNFVTKNELDLMKEGSFIVNTARGGLINLDDFAKNSKNLKLFTDVYPEEPYPDQEFLKREDVFSTPHICGNSLQATLNMGNAAIDNLVQYYKDKK